MIQNIKEGLDGRPANWYTDVFELAFHNLDRERAQVLWTDKLVEDKKDKERKVKLKHDDDD